VFLLQVIKHLLRFFDPKVKESLNLFFDSHMNSLFLDVFVAMIIDLSQIEKLEMYFLFKILPRFSNKYLP